MEQETSVNRNTVIEKLWNKYYILILFITFLINLSSIILITLLPLYALTLGGNNVVAGTLMMIFTIAALVFRPVFGKMLDHYGRRMVLILGLGMFGLSTVVLVIADSVTAIYILRFFQGIGLSAYSTALGTVLSDVIPSRRVSEGVGYYGIAATIAMAVGPTLGLDLGDKMGYQFTFVLSFGISILSAVFAYFLQYEKKLFQSSVAEKAAKENDKGMANSKVKKSGFIEVTVIRPCLVIFFIVVAISSVFSFMPLFAKERNISGIGMFFTVYAIAVIIARLMIGKLAERYGYEKIFMPAVVLTMLLFVTLVFANSLGLVLLAAVFYGVGYGTVLPIINTLVIKMSPLERRGAANATYYAAMDLGFGLGSFVWGIVSQLMGFTMVFVCCAGCVLVSILLYYRFLHSHLKNNGMN